MGSSKTSIKTNKSEHEKPPEAPVKENKFSRLSTRNILTAIGNRFFSGNQQNASPEEAKKAVGAPVVEKQSFSKEKPPTKEKFQEKGVVVSSKDFRKSGSAQKEGGLGKRKEDRDFRRFRSRYNSSMGNIMRNWMSLIYCILILRMNLIKFILEIFPDLSKDDMHLQKQIILESKTMYNMVRKAQDFSQERCLFLWKHLEKLIYSRISMKSNLEMIQGKELSLRDWKGANAKLQQLLEELENSQNFMKNIQKNKEQSEMVIRLMRLQSLTNTKNAEIEQLIEQITECKKRELNMRGTMLLKMKSFKDLKAKEEKLMSVEKELLMLKNEQSTTLKEHGKKIQNLKTQIEETDEEIKKEKEDKRRLKANLESIGDFLDRRSLSTLSE